MAPFNTKITAWSMGNDFAFIGVKADLPLDKNNLSAYVAYEQSYTGGNNGFVAETSYGYKPYSSDKFAISFGARTRVRSSNQTCEVRPEINMSGKISKDMNWYASIYDREIHSLDGDLNKNTHGAFVGLTYKTAFGAVKGEFQADSKSGCSCNFGLDINL